MKKNSLFLIVCLLSVWHFLTSTKREPNNPPVASTGAPGETTCSKTGCHSGGSFTGTVTLEGVPDTISASATYDLVLKNTSNAVRSGFQLTVLDGTDKFAGAFTQATGVSIGTQNSSGRKYARQSSPKNLSGGSVSWTFKWKAPATMPDNKATFYFTSLCANNATDEQGDNTLIGTKSVVFKSTVAAGEPSATKKSFKIYPTTASDFLQIDLDGAEKGTASVVDLNGKTLLEKNLAPHNSLKINELAAGTYFLRVSAGGKTEVHRFFKI